MVGRLTQRSVSFGPSFLAVWRGLRLALVGAAWRTTDDGAAASPQPLAFSDGAARRGQAPATRDRF